MVGDLYIIQCQIQHPERRQIQVEDFDYGDAPGAAG